MAPIPRILIVEDDEIIANLISVMLEKRGYNIVGKTGLGEESVMLAAELEPDLIIMDISLAGTMDGVTAACYIFQLFQYPIVFLTAHCDDNLLARAKNAQPLGFIIKPFNDRDLSSNVELALYNHSMRKKYLDMYPVGEPKKIIATLDSIVITDTKGKIFFCNPYALRFIDLPKEEILMHYWREVMMIINDQTNEEISDPIQEVVNQMLVISYEFNTAVVTRSGKGRKASVIIRPVKDDQHDLLGIFFHIREKTLDQIKMAKKS